MSKKRLARTVGVCAAAIIIIAGVILLPVGCGEGPPTPPTYGLQFDGVDDYVDLGATIHNNQGDITVEAWIKWDGQLRGEVQTLVTDTGARFRWQFGPEDGYIYFPSSRWGTRIEYVPPAGQWVHLAHTYEYATRTHTLYVDGVVYDSKTDTDDPHDSTVAWWIGASKGTASPFDPYRFFGGVISEVRIWNVARPQEQIRANMDKELTGSESGLVGYWKLDEGSGMVARDSTANSNEGILHGDPAWFGGGG